MSRIYLIVTVVPDGQRHFPPLREAVTGMVNGNRVPLSVAMKWVDIRRSMAPGGLKRKVKEARN